jgi:hypothetical protein
MINFKYVFEDKEFNCKVTLGKNTDITPTRSVPVLRIELPIEMIEYLKEKFSIEDCMINTNFTEKG